jgi:hypothetical protein
MCDLTEVLKTIARRHDLEPTADGLGFFGYHGAFDAYIEVISFERLIASARQRHRAFFDQLGLRNRGPSFTARP